jgi:hypothetical protein
MGLDVKVFQDITKLNDDAEDYDFTASNIKTFKDRCKNLDWLAKYKADVTKRVISYPCSVHNDFRRELATLIGKERDFWLDDVDAETPFYELFEFADNEGCMDWECAGNLYDDFVQYQKNATEKLPPTYVSIYDKWLGTFQLAKDRGVVIFS